MGRLPDDRPARPHEGERPSASRRASPWPPRRGRTSRPARGSCARGARRRRPPSGGPRRRAGRAFRARGRPRACRGHRDLVEDLAGRRERLVEDGLLVGDAVGNDAEIRLRQRQPFRVRARVAADAEDGALRAVPPEPSRAPVAAAAGEVDLADDALSEERGRRGPLDDADELVSRNPREAVVPALQLEVRVADPREEDADEREAPAAARAAARRGRRPGRGRRRARALRGCYALQGAGSEPV